MNFVINDNSLIVKFDNFSHFQNIISNNPLPTRERHYDALCTHIVMICLLLWSSNLGLGRNRSDSNWLKLQEKDWPVWLGSYYKRWGIEISLVDIKIFTLIRKKSDSIYIYFLQYFMWHIESALLTLWCNFIKLVQFNNFLHTNTLMLKL